MNMTPSTDPDRAAAPEGDASPLEPAVHDAALRRLSRAGLRYTPGRRRLVAALYRAAAPLTVEDLLALDPRLPMSSAYRDLNCLCEVGVLVRLSLLHNRNHFQFASDLLGRRELHFVCNGCAHVIAITSPPNVDQLVAAAERRASNSTFTVDRSRLALFGRCRGCRG